MKQENKDSDAWISTSKAGELLGKSRDKISDLCRKKLFKTAVQDGHGRPWRILREEVLAIRSKQK